MTETFTLSIVSHGHGRLLHSLLDDIAAFENAQSYRIVVTLNLAVEDFDASQWPRLQIHVIRNAQPKGFGANHNQAFAQCRTTWFAVLNPDLRMSQDPLPALMVGAQQVGKVGAVTPSVVSEAGIEEDHIRLNLTPSALWHRYRGQRREAIDVSRPASLESRFYWLAGMFLAFPAVAYEKIGGFDERFFLYCEDYDICVRLVLSEYRLLKVPNVQVVHAAQRDSHQSMRHLRWHLQSLAKVWTSGAFWRLLRAQRA